MKCDRQTRRVAAEEASFSAAAGYRFEQAHRLPSQKAGVRGRSDPLGRALAAVPKATSPAGIPRFGAFPIVEIHRSKRVMSHVLCRDDPGGLGPPLGRLRPSGRPRNVAENRCWR